MAMIARMETPVRSLSLVRVIVLLATILISQRQAAAFGWNSTPEEPERHGMCKSEKIAGCTTTLDEVRDALKTADTKAFMVIRNDAIIYEWYAPPAGDKNFGSAFKWGTASTAKGLFGAIAMAYAATKCGLSERAPASKYLRGWESGWKAAITPLHLISHSSGMKDAKSTALSWGTPLEPKFWDKLNPPEDPWTIARDHAPQGVSTGDYMYSNAGIALAGAVTTRACAEGNADPDDDDIKAIFDKKIMPAIDLHPDVDPTHGYSIGYGAYMPKVDGLSMKATWGGGNLTTRVTASLSRLLMRKGLWGNRHVLDANVATKVLTNQTGKRGVPARGWAWYVNDPDWLGSVRLSAEAAFAWGAGTRTVIVDPASNLIIVRFEGAVLGTKGFPDTGVATVLAAPIANAMMFTPPTCEIRSPRMDAKLAAESSVTVTASARARNGRGHGPRSVIESVEFYLEDSDGRLTWIGVDKTAPYSVRYKLSGAGDRTFVCKAIAQSDEKNRSFTLSRPVLAHVAGR
jgi:hypothetical protein